MKLKLILTSAVALVMAAPANAAYLQVDFLTHGTGTREFYENRNGIPYFSSVSIKDMTFSAYIPTDLLYSDDRSSVHYNYGYTISSTSGGVFAGGDSSADSGVPDYRYGFDFAFNAFFDNAPGNMIPLGLTKASGSAFLQYFAAPPSGDGFRDDYSGEVTGLRVQEFEGRVGPFFVYSVPEPATWALMLVGFGMMGGALRYRRRNTKVVYG